MLNNGLSLREELEVKYNYCKNSMKDDSECMVTQSRIRAYELILSIIKTTIENRDILKKLKEALDTATYTYNEQMLLRNNCLATKIYDNKQRIQAEQYVNILTYCINKIEMGVQI